MSTIALTDGDGTLAVVAPRLGGTLQRYVRQTARGPIEVLHEPGSHLMFPIAGFSHSGSRIDHYAWEGVERPMPIHGFAMRLPWTVTDVARSSLRLALGPDDATRALYPFEFRLGLSYALVEGAIRCVLEVGNVGDRPMPFSAGFHPYIRLPLTAAGRRDRCVVRLPACREAFARSQGIEIEESRAPREIAASLGAAPARSFADLDRLQAEVIDDGSGHVVGLDASLDAPFRCLTLWSPRPDAPFYCIEPRTALQDAFTHAAHRQLTVLPPGASFTATMTLSLKG